MVYQIHTSTPCRPGIPSASDYIFPISPSTRNALLPPSILKKPAHSIGSNDMISSQSSDANTASSTSSQNNDRIKLKIALRLLTTMVVATGVSTAMSLQFFLQVNWRAIISKYTTLREFYIVASEVGETLDVAVLICSTSAFFISLLQLFFVLKLYKSRNPSVSLDYLDRTSFMRLVIYSFWFLSVMLMLTAVLLLCVLNPSRGTISKGVALSLGASAMLFCSITTLKTICFWSRSTSPSATADTYKNFSTLV
ncbi:hypothetical protein Q1695_008575 [Nippostrongylus brasiliensis]|nr:hypothetical protein Q1695_008575 [Nippostrongylus brasiliensis]